MVFQCIDAFEYPVVKGFLSEIVPDMLHGIEFRRIGREGQKSHIVRNREQARGVPARSVENHGDPILGMSGSYFVEKYLHHVAVDVREDQTVELAVDDGDGAVGIGIFLGYHAVAERTGRFWAPAPPGVGDATETRFILEHYPERPFFAPFLVDFRDDLGEFFFHSSWASISAFGCRLSGASFLQP